MAIRLLPISKLALLAMVFLVCLWIGYAQERGKDGRYHDPLTGKAQPERCNSDGPHPCHCARTTMECNDKDTEGMDPGSMCQTYCRKKACLCHTCCDT